MMEFYFLKLCDPINSSLKLPSAGHSVAATTEVANTDGGHIMNGYLCSLSPLPSLGFFLYFGLQHSLVCVIYNPGFSSQHVALMLFGCPPRLWCLPSWALYQPSVSYTRLNPSLSWSLPFWAYPLSNTSSGSSVSSSFPLCESLFLQPILVSAFPRLHSLVQATSILVLKKPYWPLNSYCCPQPQPDISFSGKLGHTNFIA